MSAPSRAQTETVSQRRLGACEPTPRERCFASPAVDRSVFAEPLVLREVPRPGERALGLCLAQTEEVTRALRGALLHHAEDPSPPSLSGHALDGRSLTLPHTAFLALPGSGAGAASTVAGVAIVLPRDLALADRQAILLAAHRWEQSGLCLWLGRLGAMQLARVDAACEPDASGAGTWTRPADRWASVTPVALDRNPGDLFSRDANVAARAVLRAEEIVTEACTHIGLPRPAEVRILPRSRFPGILPAARFMPYPRRGNGFKRVCVHVEVRFEEAVAGPVVLGVGRYFGVGLLGPI